MTIYKVLRGDTMWGIAMKHGISFEQLSNANPDINNPSLIFPGQTINIPIDNASTYTVVQGDTMWNIASKHGVGLNALIKENPQLKNPSFIIPGQTINIPNASSAPSTPIIPSTPSEQSDFIKLEKEVIHLVNIERKKSGLSPLTENNEISRIARIKSNDFVKNNYFAHNSPTYGTPFNMLNSFGINFSAAAENIASGQKNANEVMNTWMSSSGHRENILNPTYNQIGVGIARDNNGNLYWTQMFIRS